MPLGVIEKKESTKVRIIHDLSYPYNENSINSSIPKCHTKVSYSTVSDAITAILNCKKDSFMAKSDLKEAYRQIPLHPSQYSLTGFCWNNNYYFDKVLP